MKFKDFITEYKIDNSSISKHIIKKYIPFQDKIDSAKKIIQLSLYKIIEIDGNSKTVVQMNTPYQYYFMILELIDKYTDIEIADNHEDTTVKAQQMLNAFNTIEEMGITPKLIDAIGDDYKAFNSILKMCVDDAIFNETNLTTFLDTKFEAISLALNTYQTAFNEVMKDNIVEFNPS